MVAHRKKHVYVRVKDDGLLRSPHSRHSREGGNDRIGRFPAFYEWIKDGAGNQFLCPIDSLKDIQKATDEEMENCVDNAVAERYAGEFKVLEK